MKHPQLDHIYHADHFGVLAPAVLKDWFDNVVDAVVTDPPYELDLMGKAWDSSGIAFSVDFWRDVLRVLKPGGHLLAFGGTRTQHRMVTAIEDAGFEIRDQLTWHYGTGYPKSMDVSKALDKAAGATRKVIGKGKNHSNGHSFTHPKEYSGTDFKPDITEPATEAAKKWEGWGTALKPASEPICLARKPLSEGTVAANVLKWGTGALNIKACSVGDEVIKTNGRGSMDGNTPIVPQRPDYEGEERVGRWPANVLLDRYTAGFMDGGSGVVPSRFFYVAKPDDGERNQGMDGEAKRAAGIKNASGRGFSEGDSYAEVTRENFHPTVKPVDLMAYLCQLVTPRGGAILDPFAGSGTTGMAAARLGFKFIGTELDLEHIKIAEKRVESERAQGSLF